MYHCCQATQWNCGARPPVWSRGDGLGAPRRSPNDMTGQKIFTARIVGTHRSRGGVSFSHEHVRASPETPKRSSPSTLG